MKITAKAFVFSLLFLPAAANAADLRPAPAQAVYDWTGFYLGANGGYGSATGSAALTLVNGPFAGLSTRSSASDVSGGVAGGQVGANWQTGMLVLGVEADYQWSGLARNVTFGCGLGCSIQEKIGLTSFGTARGRVGAAIDRVLIYATGGGAWMTVQDEAVLTAGGLSGQLSKISLSGFGWTAGGGVEVAFAPNWSLKGEYLYLSTSNLSGQGNVLGIGDARLDIAAHAHIGRAGINYKF